MAKKAILSILMSGMLMLLPGSLLAASPQQRIGQDIIVNGQHVAGATVVQNGVVQSFTCSNPQQYVNVDQSSSGWACFDEMTGAWLLHALPPQTANTSVPPSIDYSAPTYVAPSSSYDNAYDYSYPYAYGYPYYGYPYWGGWGSPWGGWGWGWPAFGFGFGFNNGFNNGHGRFNNFNHFNNHFNNFNHFNGHAGSFGRGFNGGGFSHGGGGFHGGAMARGFSGGGMHGFSGGGMHGFSGGGMHGFGGGGMHGGGFGGGGHGGGFGGGGHR